MRIIVLLTALSLLTACYKNTSYTKTSYDADRENSTMAITVENRKKLLAILDTQPEEHKARFAYRNPAKTIEFFGIQPGMTVVEHLPGDGWYSQILAGYLGNEGTLIGVDYNMTLWPHFDWMNQKFLDGRVAWPKVWTEKFDNWGAENAATPVATRTSEIDDHHNGTADVVLYIRALHNLARFDSKGAYLSESLAETYALLKPGGIVGVVQHEARADRNDEWADGSRGYLKKSFVKHVFNKAGFEFLKESHFNENSLDQPGENDIVWRLPPTYFGAKNDKEKKSELDAIGESNRMTLIFRKPGEL